MQFIATPQALKEEILDQINQYDNEINSQKVTAPSRRLTQKEAIKIQGIIIGLRLAADMLQVHINTLEALENDEDGSMTRLVEKVNNATRT